MTDRKTKPLDPNTLRWCAQYARSDMRAYRRLAKKFKPNTVGREANTARGDAASMLAYEFTRVARAMKATP